MQRSTDKTQKDKTKEHSSIFDSVPSIDLNLSKDELQILMKKQLGPDYASYSRDEVSMSLEQKTGSVDNGNQEKA